MAIERIATSRSQTKRRRPSRGDGSTPAILPAWHPDGLIELRDRKKDIIISGGENISTIEVEQVVVGHPAVLEVAVIAIPDEHWGERPKAFVTLKPGQTVSENEIIQHCRERLAQVPCSR